jgi:hypothetical protein
MKTQEIFIAHPQTSEQVSALKAFMQALKIKFEVSKNDTYNPEFAEKILQGKKDIEQGKGITLSIQELKDLCK